MALRPTLENRRLPALLAAVGFLLSLALELVHVRAYLTPSASSYCSINQEFDCATVALSSSSVFLGLPWALWGAVGFVALFVAALRRSLWLVPLATVSALASLGLLYVSVAVVGSVCVFCELVHVVALLLCAVAWLQRKQLKADLLGARSLYFCVGLPAALAFTLWLFVPQYWAAFSYKAEPPFATGKTAEGFPWIGATQPQLTVHEFTDYRCPHCASGSARSLALAAQHPGLRIVRRQHPRMHCTQRPDSCLAVRLAYCAEEQGRFWRADRWLFAHSSARKLPALEQMALDLDLNQPQLKSCIARPDIVARAAEEASFALKKRIVDTPGYLIDGKKVRADRLKAVVEERAH